LVRPVKVGHAGTLDPLATGVLILCFGRATRLVPFVQQLPKEYVATFLLGRSSETDDIERDVVELPDAPVPSQARIIDALPKFVGDIQQKPPAFSAIKVDGRRAYKMARQGQQVELAARPVTIYEIKLVEYDYPRLVLLIRCGSGTYVRSVGRDLAIDLGTAAVMSELRRTGIGDFRVEDACDTSAFTMEHVARQLLPASRAITHLPSIVVTATELERLRTGLRISRPNHGLTGDVAAVFADELVSILSIDGDQFRPTKNFI